MLDRSALDVFVYGTLKRDQQNHAPFCRGALAAEEAWTLGRLFHLPAGYPALQIDPVCVLGDATGSLAGDLALLEQWRARLERGSHPPAEAAAREAARPRAHGEVLAFDDPDVRLPRLDRLEGFRHGRRSLYLRVLVVTWADDGSLPRPAWTYVQPEPHGIAVSSGRWPG